jgi:hypothetical protein
VTEARPSCVPTGAVSPAVCGWSKSAIEKSSVPAGASIAIVLVAGAPFVDGLLANVTGPAGVAPELTSTTTLRAEGEMNRGRRARAVLAAPGQCIVNVTVAVCRAGVRPAGDVPDDPPHAASTAHALTAAGNRSAIVCVIAAFPA